MACGADGRRMVPSNLEGNHMRQLIYGMRFTGRADPSEASANVLKATTAAPSCKLTALVGSDGLSGSLEPIVGGAAAFESEVIFTGEAAFQERGSITFGENGHRLRFSTVGQGYLGPSPDARLKQGSVMWQVDGGEGQFEGAKGLITSNFFVSDGGEVTDHHFGVLFVR